MRTGVTVDRRLTGSEALAIQGFAHEFQSPMLRKLTFEQEMDLAGNMMIGDVLVRFFVAALVTFDLAASVSRVEVAFRPKQEEDAERRNDTYEDKDKENEEEGEKEEDDEEQLEEEEDESEKMSDGELNFDSD